MKRSTLASLKFVLAGMVASCTASMAAAQSCEPTWHQTEETSGTGGIGFGYSIATLTHGSESTVFVAGDYLSGFNGAITSSGVVLRGVSGDWKPLVVNELGNYGVTAANGHGMRVMTEYDPDGTGPAQSIMAIAAGQYCGAEQLPGILFVNNLGDIVGTVPLAYGTEFNMDNGVRQMAVYQAADGVGAGGVPKLYVCGRFNHSGGVGVYNPAQNRVEFIGGPGNRPYALLVHDDGSGSMLYAAAYHSFTGYGQAGRNAKHVARYDGTTWRPVGTSNVGTPLEEKPIIGLASFDQDGQGTERALLCAVSETAVHLWDGSTWRSARYHEQTIPEGVALLSGSAAEFDDGSGPALYLGAAFNHFYTTDFSLGIKPKLYRVRPNSNVIESVPGSEGHFPNYGLNSMQIYGVRIYTVDLGVGNELVTASSFISPADYIGSRRQFYSWKGTGWSANLGTQRRIDRPGMIFDMASYDADPNDLQQPLLYACGRPNVSATASSEVRETGGVSAWDGTDWKFVGEGLANFAGNSFVYEIEPVRYNGQQMLLACAETGEGLFSSQVYKFDGTRWNPIDPVQDFPGTVRVISATLNGQENVYAFGNIGILQLENSSWVPLPDDRVISSENPSCVAHTDEFGSALYYSDSSTVLRWDGTAWLDVTSNLPPLSRDFYLNNNYQLFRANNLLIAVTFEDVYVRSGDAWNYVCALPDFVSPVGVADFGDGERLYFARFYDNCGAFALQFCNFEDSDMLPVFTLDVEAGLLRHASELGTFSSHMNALPFISKVIRHDIDGVPGLCFGGNFVGAGCKRLNSGDGHFWSCESSASGFARFGCAALACRADHDQSGDVAVADIFAYLEDWFGVNTAADIDSNGRIEVQDIFVFLEAWFAGC